GRRLVPGADADPDADGGRPGGGHLLGDDAQAAGQHGPTDHLTAGPGAEHARAGPRHPATPGPAILATGPLASPTAEPAPAVAKAAAEPRAGRGAGAGYGAAPARVRAGAQSCVTLSCRRRPARSPARPAPRPGPG